MLDIVLGLIVILHGLVHLWYVTLSLGLVEFEAEMGWTGHSWLLSPILNASATGGLATILYSLAAVAMVAGGAGFLLDVGWWRPVLLGAAAFSAAVIVLFWDGKTTLLLQKGALGLVLSGVIIAALLLQ